MVLSASNGSLPVASKENLKILGKLFKVEREKQEFSLRGVAQSINLAHTVISDIENGKVIPNTDTLYQLFKAIGINLCLDQDFLESMHEHFMSFYHAVYYKDMETIKRLYPQIMKHQDKLLYSSLRPEFLLLKATYNGSITNTLVRDDVSELYYMYDYLSKEQKERFNLIKGTYYYKQGEYNNARRYLSRNLKLRSNDKAFALTLSYLAQSEACLYQSYSAVGRAKEASALHAQNNNFKRKIEADFAMIYNYIDMGQFEEALNIMQSIKFTIRSNGNDQTKEMLDSMYVYLNYRKGYFKDALALMKNASINTALQAVRLARLYVCVDESDKALNVLLPFLEDDDELTVDYHVVRLFAHNLGYDERALEIENSVEFLLSDLYQFQNIHYMHFVFHNMVEYYERQENYKKALSVAKIHMDFSKKHITNDTNTE